MQGEERDSSDEEWTNAYATMDPISQLGWRSRRVGVEGPAELMMRDILGAADVVHSDAMSEMSGSRTNNEEWHGEGDEDIVGSMSRQSSSSTSPTGSAEVDQDGA